MLTEQTNFELDGANVFDSAYQVKITVPVKEHFPILWHFVENTSQTQLVW